MKILKYFFYLLLLIFALFLAMGLLVSEVEYEVEASVNRSPEICWNVMTDKTRMTEWRQNLISIEVIDESPDKIGSEYLLTVMEADQEYKMTEIITSFEINGNYSFQLENDVLTNEVVYSLEGSDKFTQITTTYKLRGKDILMKSIFPFMKGMFHIQAKSELIKLKELIEHQ